MPDFVYVASFKCNQASKFGSAYIGAFVLHTDPDELLPKRKVLTRERAIDALASWTNDISYCIYQIHPRYMNDFRDGTYEDLRYLVSSKVPYIISVLELELGIPLTPIGFRRGPRVTQDPDKARSMGCLGTVFQELIYGSDYPALGAVIETCFQAKWRTEELQLCERWPHYLFDVNHQRYDIDFVPFEQHRKYSLETFPAYWVELLKEGSGPAFFRFFLTDPPAWWGIWFKDIPFTYYLTEEEFVYVLREFRPVYPRSFQNWLRRSLKDLMPPALGDLTGPELYFLDKTTAIGKGVGTRIPTYEEVIKPPTELDDNTMFTPVYGDELL
jgi:hypothetical protein